jgi:hypothetical protein
VSLLLRVPVDETGAYFEVEVDHQDLSGEVALVAGRPDLAEAPFSLASSLRSVLPALHVLLDGLRTLAPGPDEVTVELGLKVGGETGLVFVKGTGEATFTVNLTWRNAAA